MAYVIRKSNVAPALDGCWDGAEWAQAETMNIACVRPESSDHHPDVKLRVLYTADGIYGKYLVKDRYVRSVAKKFQDSVCLDSCVEFFIQPASGQGYVNFEMNCGGTLLAYHIIDASQRASKGLIYEALTPEDIAGLEIKSTLPKINDPELTEPTEWSLGFFFPFTIFGRTNGQNVPEKGEVWHGNFYKCGDKTSHPHWISWQPVSQLNFHMPECFGEVIFA